MADDVKASAITIAPTPAFFEAGGVLFRCWKGSTSEGLPVRALVSAIEVQGADFEMPGLVPVPPPNPEWSPTLSRAMGRLWTISGKLLDAEAEMIVAFAEHLAGLDEEARRTTLANAWARATSEGA